MIYFALLTVSIFAKAESVWDYDSCMESIVRQFTCSINGQEVFIDLETASTQLSYKSADDEEIFGVYVENVAGGKLYISCDDSAELKNVNHEVNGTSQVVTCK